MWRKEPVIPATIQLSEYIEYFLSTEVNGANASKVIVKCTLHQDKILRFSKVVRGGENKGENAELQLAKDLKVLLSDEKECQKGECSIKVILNKSPSIISAEQFTQVFRQLRSKVGGNNTTFCVSYAHPCHYANQRALTNLHRAGIKLKVLAVEDILQEAIADCLSDVRNLEKLNMIKIRGLSIMVDKTILNAAHYLLVNSLHINNTPLVENINKGTYMKDFYVTSQRQEMKKVLRSNSKSREQQKEKNKSQKIKFKQNDDENHVQIKTECKPTKASDIFLQTNNKSEMEFTTLQKTINLLKDHEKKEVSIGFEIFRQLYLITGGVTKATRSRSIEGKWTIEYTNKQGKSLLQNSGLIYKSGMEDGNNNSTVNMEQLIDDTDRVIKSCKETDFIKIEAVIANLPDKSHSVKMLLNVAEKLSELHPQVNIHFKVWTAGVENVNVPTQQNLKKMFNAKRSSLANILFEKQVKVLRTQNILNLIVDDLQIMLCKLAGNIHERGINVTICPNELTAAIHLIRNSIRLVGKQTKPALTYSLLDSEMHLHLTDNHHNNKTLLLQDILNDTMKNGRKIIIDNKTLN